MQIPPSALPSFEVGGGDLILVIQANDHLRLFSIEIVIHEPDLIGVRLPGEEIRHAGGCYRAMEDVVVNIKLVAMRVEVYCLGVISTKGIVVDMHITNGGRSLSFSGKPSATLDNIVVVANLVGEPCILTIQHKASAAIIKVVITHYDFATIFFFFDSSDNIIHDVVLNKDITHLIALHPRCVRAFLSIGNIIDPVVAHDDVLGVLKPYPLSIVKPIDKHSMDDVVL